MRFRSKSGQSPAQEFTRPPRHKDSPVSLIVEVDGCRFLWHPNSEYGKPGTVTTRPQVREKFEKAVAEKATAAVQGVLIDAGDTSEPEVLAALHAVAQQRIKVVQISNDARQWFFEQRNSAAQSQKGQTGEESAETGTEPAPSTPDKTAR